MIKFSETADTPEEKALFLLMEATHEIAHVPMMNGPSGLLLGAALHRILGANRTVEDLTVRELTTIIETARREYNDAYERAHARANDAAVFAALVNTTEAQLSHARAPASSHA